MNGRTLFRSFMWLMVIVGLGALAWVGFIEPRMNKAVADSLGKGEYRLVATDGTTFTADTLKGAPSAVFFGFTHCPEVCPTTLGDIAGWQDELGKEGEPLRTFFVTVDPERDTPEMLGDYVSWVPGVVGVSGSPEEIRKAIKAFRVYAAKVPLKEGGYTMDHSAFVMLFDDSGNFVRTISYQEDFDSAVGKLRDLLAG